MNDSAWIWPTSDMDFWKIDNKETSVKIKWSHNCFEDYKTLSYQFYKCGYKTFEEVIGSRHDNVKSDMWFLTGIFLVRHSIELGLKALLCRVLPRKRDIEDAFEACCHDVSMLFHKYTDVRLENYLTEEEEDWLIRYLDSLEEVDKKSDMFRFPFEDEFLSKYRDKFLDNVDVANNMLQGYALIKKCIERGIVTEEDEFDGKLKPEFFVFASHGIGNCYLWQRISDEGFHVKVTGYSEVIDYIYQNQNITNEDKLYPLIFMFRNTIELCLKRLFYSRVDNGVPLKVFNSKRKSHLIKKDLWKNVKPVIKKYANDSGEDLISLAEYEAIREISDVDDERVIYFTWLSVNDVHLVLKSTAGNREAIRDRFLLSLLYESGARINEVLSLKLLDVKATSSGEADVHFYGKGKKHRIAPLSREIWNQFEDYCEKYHPDKTSEDLLFYSFRNGRRNKMSSDNVSRILAGCEEEVRKSNPDLVHLHSHLFRRTRAMHLYQAGVPLSTISEWLGHSNIETTRFYAKVTEEMKREALHKLGDSDSSIFKDDVVFKYANDEDTIKRLCGLK